MSGSAELFKKITFFFYLVGSPKVGGAGDGKHKKKYGHPNARPHTAGVSMDCLGEEGIDAIDWPACSPDLNPIEHCWDMVDRRVRGREHPPSTVRGPRTTLVDEWANIPQMRLIKSMPNRCNECVNAGGGGAHKLLNVSLPLFYYCSNKANVFWK